MTRGKFVAKINVMGVGYATLDGYLQTFALDGYSVKFGIARSLDGHGWVVYELTTGLRCAEGTTRITALDEVRRRMPEIVDLSIKADKDPNYCIARDRKKLGDFLIESVHREMDS